MNRLIGIIAASVAALILTGCGTTRMVDNDVRTFAQWPGGTAPAAATYRFERLPSQQSFGERQAALEKVARASLEKVGFKYDEKSTRYSVQIGARTEREPRSPWDDPMPILGVPGRDYVVTGNGQLVWVPTVPRADTHWFKRQVTLIVRDLSTMQVVYETHALHEGRWADTDSVLPAMFDAALLGFPNAPAGPRKIEIEIPR